MDKKKVLIIAGIAGLVIILILIIGLKRNQGGGSVTLKFWGVYDDMSFYSDLISAYQKENKNVTIKYEEKPFDTYEKDLINALAAGTGPDIFSIHNTWLPKYKDKIVFMPQGENFLTLRNFQDAFVDVAYSDFVDENNIYGMPFYVDTLALYYNKDMFNSANIPLPPATWDEFLDDVERLTKKDQAGNILKSGAALGTAENINRSTDILSLLMLQTGAQMVDKTQRRAIFNQSTYLNNQLFNPGEDALRFYTDFSNPIKRVYSWNNQMPYSIDAFYEGKAAMMINYSYQIETIRSKSPYLNFGISLLPQIKNRDFDINYANYWGQAVSKVSKNSAEAWKFLIFLSKKENVKKYLELAKRPTSRRDLVDWQKEDSDLGIFASQVLSARSWYQPDSGAIEKIFADMIKSVVLGEATLNVAINKAADKVNVLIR